MKNWYILILIGLLFTACSDDLPEPTQEGANMFACRIDGNVWEAKVVPGGQIHKTEAHYFESGNFAVLTARRYGQNEDEVIEFTIRDLTVEGEYEVGFNSGSEASYRIRHGGGEETVYRTSLEMGGEVQVTRFNKDVRVLAGTFSFEASDGQGSNIELTDGRFDMVVKIH